MVTLECKQLTYALAPEVFSRHREASSNSDLPINFSIFFYLRFHKNFVNVIASFQGRMISRTDPALRKT